MNLVPHWKDLRVSLGAWKPRGAAGDVSRMPRAEVLQKAKLWTDAGYAAVRGSLCSRPLHVEISETADLVKVDVPGGSTSILVIKNNSAMPQATANIPFGAVVIDARAMTNEEGDLMQRMPGRSKFNSVPTLIIGGVSETEDVRRGVIASSASQWAGEVRPIDVYTKESHGQFTCQKRRLLAMVPSGHTLAKMPPMFNIAMAPSLTEGWSTVIGLMRFLWHRPDSEADAQTVDWLYVLSDDPMLPALLSQHLESTPSIVFCQIHDSMTIQDLGDKVADCMKLGQDLTPLRWDVVVSRWCNMQPLFGDDNPSSSESQSTSEEEAVPAPKPAPKVPKKAAGAKRSAKAKAAAKPAPQPAEAERQPSPPAATAQPPPRREERVSTSSGQRDSSTSDRDRERDRQRDRERQREAEREAERERERRRERDRRDREDTDRRRREQERQRDSDRDRRDRTREQDRERHSVVRRDSSDSARDSHSSSSRGADELRRRLGHAGYHRRR